MRVTIGGGGLRGVWAAAFFLAGCGAVPDGATPVIDDVTEESGAELEQAIDIPSCVASTLSATGTGTTRNVTATAKCVNGGAALYRFSVKAPNGQVTALSGLGASPGLNWNVAGLNGNYVLKVEVRASQDPGALLSTKTVTVLLGDYCKTVALPDTWGQHRRNQPFVVQATANCSNAEYRFERRSNLMPNWTAVCPYSSTSTCDLNRDMPRVGDYVVRALVRKAGSIEVADATSVQREYVVNDGSAFIRAIELPNAYGSPRPVAISGDGRWVLGSNSRWSRVTGGVALERAATADPVGPPFALGISADGGVIVGWDRPKDGSHTDEPFRWAAGKADWLIHNESFTMGFAWGTSASGAVIVGSVNAPGPRQQAFMWTSTGLELLGGLPGGSGYSEAMIVSGDGKVVAGVGDVAGHDEAFRWTAETGMQALGLLPGGIESRALDISQDGKVIVGEARISSDEWHAFRHTVGGGLERLSNPGGKPHSTARSASADGQVILGYSESTWWVDRRPMIWTAGSVGQYLSDFLTARGVDLTGWELETAVDVSADGKSIVGYGRAPEQTENTAWLVTLP